MKRLLSLLSIFFLVSCGPNFHPETKTVRVLYRVNAKSPLTYSDSAKYSIRKVRQFDEDSSSTSVKFVVDTEWTIKAPNLLDTIRGKDKKPLLDSLTHYPQFNQAWFFISPQDKKTIRIQIVTI